MTPADGAKVLACLIVHEEAELVVTIGENRKLLAFPLADLPVM